MVYKMPRACSNGLIRRSCCKFLFFGLHKAENFRGLISRLDFCIFVSFCAPLTGRSTWTTLGWLSTWWKIKPETLVIEISSTRTLFKIVLWIPDLDSTNDTPNYLYGMWRRLLSRDSQIIFQTIGSKRRWNSNIRIHHWLRSYCWSRGAKFTFCQVKNTRPRICSTAHAIL